MKRLRKWMLVTACAALGAAALYCVAWLVLDHVNWGTALGLNTFDSVSQDAAVAFTVLGLMLGVGLTLGAVGGVSLGLSLERRLASLGERSPDRRTA